MFVPGKKIIGGCDLDPKHYRPVFGKKVHIHYPRPDIHLHLMYLRQNGFERPQSCAKILFLIIKHDRCFRWVPGINAWFKPFDHCLNQRSTFSSCFVLSHHLKCVEFELHIATTDDKSFCLKVTNGKKTFLLYFRLFLFV